MDELRAIFAGGQQTGLSAQKTFTNRVGEVDAFRKSVAAMLRARSAPASEATLDMAKARRNVLVYYGLGGIGKTELSKHLERAIVSADVETWLPKRRVGIRVDFGEGGELDLETVLLTLRSGLGEIQPRWRAFDFVLARYWAQAHNGEPLPEYIRSHPRLGRRFARTGMADQLEETMRQVLYELGLAWAPARLAKSLISLSHERLSESLTYRSVSDSCPFFLPLTKAEPGPDLLSYLPSLLAWELDRRLHKEPDLVVMFLDTFEPITTRQSREFERLLQRMIFLLPQVLFVLTTRQRLDWAELKTTAELDYTGSARWPGLLASNNKEPRQHLVGELSVEDCEVHLRRTLRLEDDTPALSPQIRRRITKASGGLPLYLDLALTQYLEIATTGTPKPSDFGAPLPHVVTSIMRHLDDEGRNILRGMALLDAFDVDLAATASGARDAAVLAILRSPMVVETNDLAWPHALHPVLRKAIRGTDHQLTNTWSSREWAAAAQRLTSRLGELCTEAIAKRQRVVVASCFTQGLRLCGEFSLSAPWLIQATELLVDCGMWSTLDVHMPQDKEPPDAVMAFLTGLAGLRLRRTGSLKESVRVLDSALDSNEISEEIRAFLELHRAHAVRNAGSYQDAQRTYGRLASGASAQRVRARLQLADLQMLRGRFSTSMETLDALESLDRQLDADLRGEAMRIRGHIHRTNCELDLAELAYRRALTLSRAVDSPAMEGKALTNLAETVCWSDPAQGVVFAEQALSLNRGINNQLEVLKAHVAAALCHRSSEGEAQAFHIEQARRLIGACEYRAGEVFVRVAETACAVKRGEAEGQAAQELRALTADLGVYGFWVQISSWWLGAPRTETVETDWLADPAVIRARWMRVL